MSAHAEQCGNVSRRQTSEVLKILVIAALYIVLSGSLINFNKYLMHKDRFPHPMFLTSIHMFSGMLFSTICYITMPSLFPGMVRVKGRKLELLRWFVPIGLCFAIMLYGSNRAYLYCSVAFLQFMKEANVIICFLLSCAFGLQTMNRQRLAVIVWVIAGSSMCVAGDMNFVIIGFVIQLISQLSECCRAVMGEWILSGSDIKLDPMSYTMFVTPICFAVLAVGNLFTWEQSNWQDLKVWWPILVPNAMLAFALNVMIAMVIKNISALGFVITGIVKDIVLVVFSSVMFQDQITSVQWCSFCVTISGVCVWSLMKVAPSSWPVVLLERILQVPTNLDIDESTPLMPEKKV